MRWQCGKLVFVPHSSFEFAIISLKEKQAGFSVHNAIAMLFSGLYVYYTFTHTHTVKLDLIILDRV